jgi:hypothetical protein
MHSLLLRYLDLDRRTILAHCAAFMYVAQTLEGNNYNRLVSYSRPLDPEHPHKVLKWNGAEERS